MTFSMGLAGAWMAALPLASGAQHHDAHHGARTDIPKSVQEEHREIHSLLEVATRRKDAIGAAARELAQVLHPHFVREEEIALKPLGALPMLIRGQRPSDADRLIAMADSLERELPRMLEEHKMIAMAVTTLEAAAEKSGEENWVRFARQLRQHALAEEEVYYPAAVLVGRFLSQVIRK